MAHTNIKTLSSSTQPSVHFTGNASDPWSPASEPLCAVDAFHAAHVGSADDVGA